ncbi:MAG: DUF1326 domain-containing protein [Acidobacteriia bacterium]|nr:DUF1326 domain-containing protein [Terriglobia bacterium]
MSYLCLMMALLASVELTGPNSAVTGQYLEDRSSRVYGCPCEWSSEYVSYGREAVLAWKIESGEYAGERLAGLRMAAVLSGEFTLSAATSLRHSTVFVDAGAGEVQRGAGVAWLRSRYGDILGSILGIHVAPIEFKLDAESAKLRVGDVLEVQMRRANFLEDTQPWASLLYDPLTKLTSSTLGTTFNTHYTGPDLQIRWTRRDAAITGYYGTFSLK